MSICCTNHAFQWYISWHNCTRNSKIAEQWGRVRNRWLLGNNWGFFCNLALCRVMILRILCCKVRMKSPDRYLHQMNFLPQWVSFVTEENKFPVETTLFSLFIWKILQLLIFQCFKLIKIHKGANNFYSLMKIHYIFCPRCCCCKTTSAFTCCKSNGSPKSCSKS